MKKLILLLLLLPLVSCSGVKNNSYTNVKIGNTKENVLKKVVTKNDKVSVDYIGYFSGNKIFDTSLENIAKKAGIYNSARIYKPLEFVVGLNKMIPCFENAIIGMKVGDEKEIICQPEEAYGQCDPSKIQKISKSQLESFVKMGYKLEKGEKLPTQYGLVKIIDSDKDNVVLDLNNPLCGKVLKFKIILRKIF